MEKTHLISTGPSLGRGLILNPYLVAMDCSMNASHFTHNAASFPYMSFLGYPIPEPSLALAEDVQPMSSANPQVPCRLGTGQL